MFEPVAQLVEQRPFKPWVEGSSPSRLTILFVDFITGAMPTLTFVFECGEFISND